MTHSSRDRTVWCQRTLNWRSVRRRWALYCRSFLSSTGRWTPYKYHGNTCLKQLQTMYFSSNKYTMWKGLCSHRELKMSEGQARVSGCVPQQRLRSPACSLTAVDAGTASVEPKPKNVCRESEGTFCLYNASSSITVNAVSERTACYLLHYWSCQTFVSKRKTTY